MGVLFCQGFLELLEALLFRTVPEKYVCCQAARDQQYQVAGMWTEIELLTSRYSSYADNHILQFNA